MFINCRLFFLVYNRWVLLELEEEGDYVICYDRIIGV